MPAASGPQIGHQILNRGKQLGQDTLKGGMNWLTHMDATEIQPRTESSIVTYPMHVIINFLRGSLANVYRVGGSVVRPTAQSIEAAVKTLLRPFFSPMRSVLHPIETLAHPTAVATNIIEATKNAALALIRAMDNATENAISGNMKLTANQAEKVPTVGPTVAYFLNKIASALEWAPDKANKGTSYITKFIDKINAKTMTTAGMKPAMAA